MNSDDENFKLWEQPDDYESRGLLAFQAFQAVQRQDAGSLDDFHMALLKLRHEEKRELNERETVLEAAGKAGLDLNRFQKDLSDPSLKPKIGEDYLLGARKYGVFGVPTILIDNGEAAFIKLDPIPEGEQAVDLLENVLHLLRSHSCLKEIKKPVPPI